MPGKYTVKIYVEDSYYHIYNRGVEKRKIFLDRQDYHVILQYLKEALSPPPDPKTLLKDVSFKGLSPLRVQPLKVYRDRRKIFPLI